MKSKSWGDAFLSWFICTIFWGLWFLGMLYVHN